jgi:hypothetical protein
VRLMQHTLREAPTMKKRAKSVYQTKNLGTIKDRKKKKLESNKEGSNGETILRILRMRFVAPLASFISNVHEILGLEHPTSSRNNLRPSTTCRLNRKRKNERKNRGKCRGRGTTAVEYRLYLPSHLFLQNRSSIRHRYVLACRAITMIPFLFPRGCCIYTAYYRCCRMLI